MTVLAIEAAEGAVRALVVSEAGAVLARAEAAVETRRPAPGRVEQAPEDLWAATVGATRDVLEQVDPAQLVGIGLTARSDALVLWDRDTLGSPRHAILGTDRRPAEGRARLVTDGHLARVRELTGISLDPDPAGAAVLGPALAWVAEHEPHTWALVAADRYAAGGIDSYLVARMTRGLEHLTDLSSASRSLLLDLDLGVWSAELCALLGVTPEALPELVPSWGRLAVTEAATFLGLELPLTAVVSDRTAALVGLGCREAGAASHSPGRSRLRVAGGATRPAPGDHETVSIAWRAPTGETAWVVETDPPDVVPADAAALGAAHLAGLGAGLRESLADVPGSNG